MTIDFYIKKFRLDPILIDPIIHEEALSSLIFKITLKDGTFLILKISHDERRFRREFYFLDLLKDYIKVPKIKGAVEPREEIKGALLLEYLPGEIASLEGLSSKRAFEMGELLARLHCFPCKFYGDVSEKKKLPPTFKSGISILNSYFDEAFHECKNVLEEKLFKKIKKYVKEVIGSLKELSGPCICHRDFKPGNVIVFQDKIIGLIDWEIARFSFAEEDFGTMDYFVFEREPKMKDSFLKGYSLVRPLPNLELMDLMVVRKALGSLGFAIERQHWSPYHKSIIEKDLNFLENFFK